MRITKQAIIYFICYLLLTPSVFGEDYIDYTGGGFVSKPLI
jgi:hypothetical protein